MISRVRGVLRWVVDRVLPDRAERRAEEEFAFHIDMETRKNVDAGMSQHEARRQAVFAFGGRERFRQELRDTRGVPLLDGLRSDLRFAWRSLRRSPGPALVAAVSIGVGVGGSVTVFSVANGLLFKSADVPDPDRLVSIQEFRNARSTGLEGHRIPFPRYQLYERRAGAAFESLAAHRVEPFSVRTATETFPVEGAAVTDNYFDVVGVVPFRGTFLSRDQGPSIVLSHRLWRARFGGSEEVVGSPVYLDGQLYTVTGVAPPSFEGVALPLAHDLWVPITEHRPDALEGTHGTRVVPFGRLAPDVGLTEARAVVEGIGLGSPPADAGVEVFAVDVERMRGATAEGRTALAAVFGGLLAIAVLVLLIAAANVAGMLLARSVARSRELAIRMVLGSGRRRLVRHLMAETLLLFAVGGLLGVALAYQGTAAVQNIPLPFGIELGADFSLDLRTLLFALGLTALTGLVFALAPALRSSRPDLQSALRAGDRGSVGVVRGRDLFVGGQIAAAVLLLLIAGLFVRSLNNSLHLDPGFDPNGVVLAELDLSGLTYDSADTRAFQLRLLEEVRSLRGIQAAALAQSPLLGGSRNSSNIRVERENGEDDFIDNVSWNVGTPGLVQASGLEVVAGRWLDASDGLDRSPVAVVNQTMADRVWPGTTPVGRSFSMGPTTYTVVGVIRDPKVQYLSDRPAPYYYRSLAQTYEPHMVLHARVSGALPAARQAILERVRQLEPDLAVRGPATHLELVEGARFPLRLAVGFSGFFGLIGLLLAALGVYGVVAFQVARRTREFGVRRALGAQGRDLVRWVVRRGVVLGSIGGVVGLALAALTSRLLGSFLVDVSPMDPATFLVVPLLMTGVVVLATLVPARRAARVEPVEALREE